MIRRFIYVFLFVTYVLHAYGQTNNYARYVNPIIGTDSSGHTFPGATLPFAMVQASPETGFTGWEHCSGYHYQDNRIYGFSQTHLSGTGAKDLGDILILPFKGNYHDTLSSGFIHKKEKALPGYYSVILNDFKIKTEVTTTQRTALYRISNLTSDHEMQIAVNLESGLVNLFKDLDSHVIKSELHIINNTMLQGYTITKGWAGIKHVYFVVKFQKPFVNSKWLSDSTIGRNQIMSFGFVTKKLLVKIGLSTVSVQNALVNLDAENPSWDFDNIQNKATQTWNKYLSTISIDGKKMQKNIFYTALYHAIIAPNNLSDYNGTYRGVDNEVYYSKDTAYYSTLSLWDTYRAQNPLLTIIAPNKVKGIVNSMIAHYKVQGFLPIWTLWGHENYCMIANHAIPVIVDACLKGIYTSSIQDVLRAVVETSKQDHKGSEWSTYMRYGYYPSDIITKESVSKTLESCFDDWSVARLAKYLHKEDTYEEFNRRAGYYKNLFDPSVGFMRGKNADGSWSTPFNAFDISHAGSIGGNYTEGNAWQYVWSVQHDVAGLIKLFGDKESFIRKLDSLFKLPAKAIGKGLTVDVTGLIGQYAQGNEPCHHVPYLYTLAGEPWRTSEVITDICNKFYKDTPDGLCGNDDCGQMSAWYIFSALGFYPLDPISGGYIFGRPFFKKAQIRAGKKIFVVSVENLNKDNIYIQKIYLNNERYYKPYIEHSVITKGGSLVFIMGDKKIDYTKNKF